jgi:ribosomal protein S18 acetylase RimI-like enzyme
MINIEQIEESEVAQLLSFVNDSREGMHKYIWSQLAKAGIDVNTIGTDRLRDSDRPDCFSNFKVIRNQGEIVSVCCSYQTVTPHAIEDLLTDVHAIWPIPVLQSRARDSWLIDTIGTVERWQKEGLASALIADAENMAKEHGIKRVSAIVASENTAAKKLFEKHGFSLLESVPVHKFPSIKHGGEWELLVKDS